MSEESRRKRRWDQPDESIISPNICLPVTFPVTNAGFFPINQLTEAPILQQQAVAVNRIQIQADFFSTLSKPQDELLIAREIVINDAEASVRYKLTRRQTQEEIQKSTGAVVITRGKYRPPNATPDGEKPLYLHVSAGSHLKETAEKIIAVDRAAVLVEDMMKPTMKAFNTSVYLGFDADPSLNILTRIRGPNDQYINHIMNETGVTVLLRGHGSRHAGSANLEEGDQPLHLFLSSNNPQSLENARLLVENLLDTISRECGITRVAPVKVYAAVPPPQDLLTRVQYSGIEGGSVVANCSSPAVNAGVCMYGPAAQAVQTNAVCYPQPSLGIGTCYSSYAGLYPQATPLQQAALSLTQPSVSTPSLNDRRPPQKRKFKELPPASNGTVATHQVPDDLSKSSLGNLTMETPPKKLSSGIPSNGLQPPQSRVVQAKDILTPPVPKFSSAPSKNMLPPPRPKCNSTTSIHVSTDNVPDTLVKLMEYGEDDDDDPD